MPPTSDGVRTADRVVALTNVVASGVPSQSADDVTSNPEPVNTSVVVLDGLAMMFGETDVSTGVALAITIEVGSEVPPFAPEFSTTIVAVVGVVV